MRLYNRYLTALGVLFAGTTVLLAVYDQRQLDLYFSAFLIEYLATTIVFSALDTRARRLLSATASILFGGFLAIVTTKVIGLLAAAGAL